MIKFSDIPKDKIYHFSVCCILSIIISIALFTIGVEYDKAYAVGTLSTILLGIAKEMYDKVVVKSQFSISDLVADMFGVICGFVVLLGIGMVIN